MIAGYPLVTLDDDRTALVLHRKVLANGASPVAQEGMGEVKRLGGEEGVEEVVEGRFENVGRADVGGEGLVVAGCGAMECFDGARGIDAVRAGVLQANRVS